jgi:hypothetical protein
MLFMVVERFKTADPKPIGERFERQGRMLPDGVQYHASWIDASGARCFQIMEAADLASLQRWAAAWDDLVDFKFIPVETSAEFWAASDSVS